MGNNIVLADDFTSEYQINNLNGYLLLKEGDHSNSIDYFKKSIDLNPDYAVAYNNLGSAYYSLKKYDKAIGYFEKAIELEEDYVRAYINIASCYFWKRRYHTAFRYYYRGQRIDESYVEARLDIDKSIDKVEKELEKYPDDEELNRIYDELLKLQ